MGAKGLARAKVGEGGEWTQSPLAKTITAGAARRPSTPPAAPQPGDLLLFQFGKEAVVQTVMANLRLHLGKKLGLIPEYGSGGNWSFLWVVNPPLFEFDEEAKTVGRRAPRLHPAARRVPCSTCETDPGQGRLLPLRLRAQRLRDRRRLDPPPRSGGAGPGLPGAGHLRRGRASSKFGFLLDALKMRRPARTAASPSAWTGS